MRIDVGVGIRVSGFELQYQSLRSLEALFKSGRPFRAAGLQAALPFAYHRAMPCGRAMRPPV